jgi:hypothetical protein
MWWFYLVFAAFYRGWDMAFVIVATLPFLVGVGMAISVVTGKLKVFSFIWLIGCSFYYCAEINNEESFY